MHEPRDLAEYQTDHDLIVGLVRDIKHLSGDVGELKNAVNKKNDDHEARIRDLERRANEAESSNRTWRFVTSTAFSVIGVVLTILGLVLAFFH
jgi:hypothetical protein